MFWALAGILIVEEAGGRISNERGEAYRLGDPVIVASNGLNHHDFIAHIAPYQ